MKPERLVAAGMTTNERARAAVERLRELQRGAKAPWSFWDRDAAPYRITDSTGEYSALLDASEDCEGFSDGRAAIAVAAVNALSVLLDCADALADLREWRVLNTNKFVEHLRQADAALERLAELEAKP